MRLACTVLACVACATVAGLSACGGSGRRGSSPAPLSSGGSPSGFDVASPTVGPTMAVVRLTGRNGSDLTVTLPNSETVTIDLHDVAVFDCRTDCLFDVKAQLAPLASTDRLCLLATLGKPVQPWKLWVNRRAPCS